MPSILEKLLEDFGLNKKETKIYLVCLGLGPSFAAHIARKTGLNRSTCYVVLESLIRKGLVTKSGAEKKFQFTAETPERLINLIQNRQKKDKALEKKLTEVLPELESLCDTSNKLPKIKFVEGAEGVKSIYEDVLKSTPKGGEYWHCDPNTQAYLDILSEDYVSDFIKRRIKKGIHSRAMADRIPWVEKERKRDKISNRESIVLPEKIKIPARLYIYHSKTAILSLKKEPTGVLIEDKSIAEMMRMLYQALWDKCKK